MVRRLVPLAIFLGALLVFAPNAHAQDCGDRCIQNPDDGGYADYDPMSGTNPPTVNACSAYASNNQSCRVCSEVVINGVDQGYATCGYTSTNASCYCDKSGTPSCAGKGMCTYKNY